MHRSAELSQLLQALDAVKKNGSSNWETLNSAVGKGFQKNSRVDADTHGARNEQNGRAGGAGAEGAADAGAGAEGAADAGVAAEGAADAGVASEGAADAGVATEGAADAGVATEGAADAGGPVTSEGQAAEESLPNSGESTAGKDTAEDPATPGEDAAAGDADASTREKQEDEEDDIFGVKPTLGFAKGISSKRIVGGNSVGGNGLGRGMGGNGQARNGGVAGAMGGMGGGMFGGGGEAPAGSANDGRVQGASDETRAGAGERVGGDVDSSTAAGTAVSSGVQGEVHGALNGDGQGKGQGPVHGQIKGGEMGDGQGGATGKEGFTSLEEAEKYWTYVLDCVQQEGPDVLFYQLQRVTIKKSEGRRMLMAVDNELSRNMVEENQERLATLFARVSGQRIRVKCTIENQHRRPETIHPYEKFKEMQKSDPLLKDLVDLFGAELDYD